MDFPFKSDGCSFIQPLYRFFGAEPPAAEFCRLHDVDFWAGGPLRDFWQANKEFRERTRDSGFPILAWLRWGAVSIGGLPFPLAPPFVIPLPWRWGFGWRWWRFRLFRNISVTDQTEFALVMRAEVKKMLKTAGAA